MRLTRLPFSLFNAAARVKMKLMLVSLFFAGTAALQFSSSFTPGMSSVSSNSGVGSSGMSMEYIPSGVSKEQWKAMKAKEKAGKKNLGKVGITSFQSRTFADWQKSGGKNLFPVDPKKVKNASELPYMQVSGARNCGMMMRCDDG